MSNSQEDEPLLGRSGDASQRDDHPIIYNVYLGELAPPYKTLVQSSFEADEPLSATQALEL